MFDTYFSINYFQVDIMTMIGGPTPHKCTFNCVRRVLTEEAILKTNWDGSSGCYKFPRKIASGIIGKIDVFFSTWLVVTNI